MSLLGAKTSAATLGLCESKFGGAPYCEDEDFGPFSFLGQIDLAQATQALPEARRLRGLLRIDVTNRTDFTQFARAVWSPEPNEERAKRFHAESLATWETRLSFEAGWCLPQGRQLERLWPLDIPSYELDALFLPPYADKDDTHLLLGHRSSGLDEPYDFEPPAGMSRNIEDYAQLLRLTFDNAAGVHWGSNVLYFLVLEADLERGDLSRVVCTAANY